MTQLPSLPRILKHVIKLPPKEEKLKPVPKERGRKSKEEREQWLKFYWR